MPFCTNCGTSVGENASFCHACGAAQPRSGSPGGSGASASSTYGSSDTFAGISDRTAAILCYIPVFGVIPAIIFLASQRFRHNPRVRFDGFQALYLFVAWLIVSSAAPTLFLSGIPGHPIEHAILGVCRLALMICWIYLLIKAAKEEQVRIPIIGDLAARSTTEQL